MVATRDGGVAGERRDERVSRKEGGSADRVGSVGKEGRREFGKGARGDVGGISSALNGTHKRCKPRQQIGRKRRSIFKQIGGPKNSSPGRVSRGRGRPRDVGLASRGFWLASFLVWLLGAFLEQIAGRLTLPGRSVAS